MPDKHTVRTIDHIMGDFDLVRNGLYCGDGYDILSEIIEDVVDTYRLAMREAGVDEEVVRDIDATVTDYVVNKLFG